MGILLKIYLKNALRLTPVFMVIVASMLIIGQMSAYSLGLREPELAIAVKDDCDTKLALAYVDAIKKIEGLAIIDYGDAAALGTLTIPPYFDEYLKNDKDNALIFEVSPGIADVGLLLEHLSVEAAVLKSEIFLRRTLDRKELEIDYKNYQILSVKYDGEKTALPFSFAPVFGVPALFMLTAFIYGAAIMPGADTRRFLVRGRRIRTAAFCSLVSVILVYMLIIGVYIMGMRIIFDVSVPIKYALLLMAIAGYCALLGSIFAFFGKRRLCIPIFAIWLILNMTLGGGLWNYSPLPFMPYLLPIQIMIH